MCCDSYLPWTPPEKRRCLLLLAVTLWASNAVGFRTMTTVEMVTMDKRVGVEITYDNDNELVLH